MRPIYLDYNATTPIDPVVFAAMVLYLREHFGNPSSDHARGERTRRVIAQAREQGAALLDAAPEDIVFTGSGNEANHLALKAVALAYRARGNHMITSAIEHPGITTPLRFLERHDDAMTVLPVDSTGLVSPRTSPRLSPTRPSSSLACTPITKSARSSLSVPLPSSPMPVGSSCTQMQRKALAKCLLLLYDRELRFPPRRLSHHSRCAPAASGHRARARSLTCGVRPTLLCSAHGSSLHEWPRDRPC